MNKTNKWLLSFVLAGLTASVAQATSLAGFDLTLLRPYIAESRIALDEVKASLEPTRNLYYTFKSYSKALYARQKDAVKAIKDGLKDSARFAKLNGQPDWYTQRQLYKAFKEDVYKYWKRTGLLPSV